MESNQHQLLVTTLSPTEANLGSLSAQNTAISEVSAGGGTDGLTQELTGREVW